MAIVHQQGPKRSPRAQTCPACTRGPLEAALGHAGGLSAVLLALLQPFSNHCGGRIPDGSALQLAGLRHLLKPQHTSQGASRWCCC